MNPRRIFAIAYKEALQVWRDPRSLAIALLMPLMQMVLLGYGISLDIKHVPLCLYDQENSQTSREMLQDFTASGWFKTAAILHSNRGVRTAMDDATCIGALVIPVNFSRVLAQTGQAQVQAVFDGTDANTTNIATGYAQGVIAQTAATFGRRWDAQHGIRPATVGSINLESRVWFNETLDSRNFIIPGVVAIILALVGAQLTSLTIAREWERGTMEQLISTPVTSTELLIGKLSPYFLIGLLDAAFCLLTAAYWFHVPFRGSVFTLILTTALFGIVVMGIGYLLSVRIHNQLGASQIALMLTMLPIAMLSGYTFPLDQMPASIRAISLLVYARYYVTILRDEFLKGSSLTEMASSVAALLLYTVAVLWLAARAFRKRLD